MSGTTEQDSTTPVLYEPDHAQLKAKINAFICANGDANVTQAAREVTRQVLAPPSMSISPSSAEVALAAFWAAYLSIVKSVPSANVEKLRRLADVVQAIRGIEDFALEPWGSDGSARPKLWSDLPFLGVEMRHEWSVDPQDSPQQTAESLSLVTFAALLTSSGAADYSNYAVWDFRDSLEGRGTAPGTSVIDAFMGEARARVHRLRCCSVWLDLAGRSLYDRPESLILSTPGGHMWEKNPATKNTRDGKERWAFWKAQSEKLQEGGHMISGEAHKLATAISERLAEAEKEK